MAERYDAAAARYERYWAPVLAPTALKLLTATAERVTDPRVVMDLGTGTGTLAAEALQRWPEAEVVGVDVSDGMLGIARATVAERVGREAARRLRLVQADAQRLPLASGSVDLCVTSFVMQLVLDRPAALREVRRVLAPGGLLALVTWQSDRSVFRPDEEFDEAVLDLQIEEDEAEEAPHAGDFVSARAAASQLRRAGYRGVEAVGATLEHAWDLESFMEFKERYDEPALFGSLDEGTADRLRRRARERLATLPPDAFVWRTPVVFAWGRAPGAR